MDYLVLDIEGGLSATVCKKVQMPLMTFRVLRSRKFVTRHDVTRFIRAYEFHPIWYMPVMVESHTISDSTLSPHSLNTRGEVTPSREGTSRRGVPPHHSPKEDPKRKNAREGDLVLSHSIPPRNVHECSRSVHVNKNEHPHPPHPQESTHVRK